MITINCVTLDNNLFIKYIVRINRNKESFWDIIDEYISQRPTSRKSDLSFTYQHNLEYQWFAGGIVSLKENGEPRIKYF